VKSILFISIGAFLQGIAMSIFLFPHDIPSGGAAGVAILMNYFFLLPNGVSLWVFNFILLLFALKWLGKSKAVATIYAITITSVTITAIESMNVTIGYLFVDLVIGAVIFGCGVGILFKHGSSSGGMAIVALLMEKYRGKRPGRSMFFINTAIFLMISFVKDWKIILLAILCQWISTKVIDFIYQTKVVKSEVQKAS
jgi:uncharacterized membrane-anchored protein YitT (DUF2179 family)